MHKRDFRGALALLMKKHPDIEQLILRLHRARAPRMPITLIHRRFLDALRAKELHPSDYPFNTFDCGLIALRNFLRKADDVVCRRPIATRNAPKILSPVVRHDPALAVMRVVCGNLRHGRCPYVNFEGTRYKGPALSQTYSLIGKKVALAVDPKDVRTITAYTKKGQFIGNLTNQRLRCLNHPVTLEDYRRIMREKRHSSD